MQSSWFKNSRFQRGRGKGAGGAGLGYRDRPAIGYDPSSNEVLFFFLRNIGIFYFIQLTFGEFIYSRERDYQEKGLNDFLNTFFWGHLHLYHLKNVKSFYVQILSLS